jgi:hypothetical protein
VSLFVDQSLLQLGDPAQLLPLLAPPADATQQRIRSLVQAVYDLPFATLQGVTNLSVKSIEREKAIVARRRTTGTLIKNVPVHERSDILLEQKEAQPALWVDVLAELSMVLLLDFDAGAVESIAARPIPAFQTINEFRANFTFLDVDAFLAKHHITTVEELREAFEYVRAEIRLKPPPPFNPASPDNQFSLTLTVAIFIQSTLDLAAAMREAKAKRAALTPADSFPKEVSGAEMRAAVAPVVVFPLSSIAGQPFNQAQAEAFFQTERVLALFTTPP